LWKPMVGMLAFVLRSLRPAKIADRGGLTVYWYSAVSQARALSEFAAAGAHAAGHRRASAAAGGGYGAVKQFIQYSSHRDFSAHCQESFDIIYLS
ncbi:unnamed protein product, partial [marine sediment metagenome]